MADNMPLVARIMVEHGGGGPPSGPGVPAAGGGNGKPDPTNKKIKENSEKQLKQGKTHLAKTIGINVGTASILKQSQVFTGYIGTIFQLMGALVDVILAPFLPILIPAIKLLASFIPVAQKIMSKIVGGLVTGLATVAGWIAKLYNLLPQPFKALGAGLGKVFKYALVAVLIGLFLMKLVGAGKIADKLLLGGIKIALRPLQLIYHRLTKQFPFLKRAAKPDVSADNFYRAAQTPGSIYVKDIMARRAGAAGMAGMGKGAARNAKGTNKIMSTMSGRTGRLTSLSGKFFGKNLMRLGGMGILLTGMTGLLGRGFSSLKDGLGTGFSALKRGIGIGTDAVTRLVPRIPIAVNNSKNLIMRALGAAKNAAFATGRFIAGGAVAGFNIIKVGVLAAKDGIIAGGKWGYNLVKGGLTAAKNAITSGLSIAKTFIGNGLSTAKTAIVNMASAIGTKLTAAKDFIGGKLTAAKDGIKNGLVAAKNFIGTGLTTAKNAITSGLTTAKTAITGGLTTAKTFIGNSLGTAKTAITNGLTFAKDGIRSGLTTAKTAIIGGLTTLGSTIGGFFTGLGSKLGGLFGGIGGLLKKIPGVAKATEIAKKVADKAGKAAKSGWGFLKRAVSTVGSTVKDAVKATKDAVVKNTQRAKSYMGRKLGGVVGGATDLGEKSASKSGKGFFGRILSPITKSSGLFAKAAKFVPGLNVAAEVVLGTYKTVQAFRKYGVKGAITTGAFAASAVGAAAGASFIPGGTIASAGYSIGGYMAIDKLMEAKYAKRDKGNQGVPPPMTINIVQETGIGTPFEQHQERVQANANGEITVRTRTPYLRGG